jgi:putative transposase
MRDFSEFIRKQHSKISTHMNLLEKKQGRRIWYSFSDRKIRGDRHKHASFHYIHNNAVKHGWVQQPELWPWSSIHENIEKVGKEKLIMESKKYDLSKYGLGWDF